MADNNNHAAFIWSVADLLPGHCKQPEYGRLVLPPTVLRRLDSVNSDMLDAYEGMPETLGILGPVLDGAERLLLRAARTSACGPARARERIAAG